MKNSLLLSQICILSLFLFSLSTNAQGDKAEVIFNSQVQVNVKGEDRKLLTEDLSYFLTSINYNTINEKSGVDINYLKTDPNPFPFLMNVQKSGRYNNPFFYKPVVSYVVPKSNGTYIVKIAFLALEPDSQNPVLREVSSIVAKKVDGRFKFYPPLEEYTGEWQYKQIGSIIYHYQDDLNDKVAKRFSKFNAELAKEFNTDPIVVNYYKCKDPREVFYLLGSDYAVNAYLSNTGGLAQSWRNYVFSGNNSEWYPHELVHLYTAKRFGTSLNRIADEGYCTYLGGSGDVALKDLKNVLKNFLIQEPNSDILHLFLSDHQIDSKTSFLYTVSGLLMEKITEVHSLEGVEKIISTPNNEDAYFDTLDELLQINKTNFSEKIRNLLE